MTRWQKLAASASCVTIRIVARWDSFMAAKASMTSREAFESRLPVGSSAKISEGS
ncbi:hypothetical protein D3C76_1759340 [compost metagenome]